MRIFHLVLLSLFVHFSCRNKPNISDNNIEYVSFGYDFIASDNQDISTISFLIKDKKLFEISQKEEKKESSRILDFEINKINPIFEKLPVYNYTNRTKIGNRNSKNDNTPWFVKIKKKKNIFIEIGSNNLPEEFSDYEEEVVRILQLLYNRN